jgi:CheY-like chemotaxis protein
MSIPPALIIDDNRQNVEVLQKLLARQSIESIPVYSPEALEAMEILEASVIFLDLEMPKRDGFQVLQWLRAQPQFDQTPIIAYTVHLSEITVAHQQGFDGFLGKPIDPHRFPEQVARILRGEAVWEAV